MRIYLTIEDTNTFCGFKGIIFRITERSDPENYQLFDKVKSYKRRVLVRPLFKNMLAYLVWCPFYLTRHSWIKLKDVLYSSMIFPRLNNQENTQSLGTHKVGRAIILFQLIQYEEAHLLRSYEWIPNSDGLLDHRC